MFWLKSSKDLGYPNAERVRNYLQRAQGRALLARLQADIHVPGSAPWLPRTDPA